MRDNAPPGSNAWAERDAGLRWVDHYHFDIYYDGRKMSEDVPYYSRPVVEHLVGYLRELNRRPRPTLRAWLKMVLFT